MTATLLPNLESLSLREKLAQLLFVRIGSNLSPVRTVEDDVDRVKQLLDAVPLGGLLLFNGQADRTAKTLEGLQQSAPLPLLIGSDIERGVGQQLRGYTLFPHAMAFDSLDEEAPHYVREFARLTGLAAREHGIHITFAPVADVNINPRNPIIATRAFGNDPRRVAELVTAYVEGCHEARILATAKHYPGHGNTHEDSHHALPSVLASREELAECELVPFRAAVEAKVPLIMTAHVQYPAWDSSGTPATLSKIILQDILRDELKFDGAIVSDSLLMEGVKSQFANEGDLVLHTLLAGVDFQLDVADPITVLATLEQAVDTGRLPIERVDQAVSRVLRLKQTVFETPNKPANDNSLSEIISESERLAKFVARLSIRTTAAKIELTPIAPERQLLVVMLRPHQSHLDPAEQPLREFLDEKFSHCDYLELRPDSSASDYEQALKKATAAELIVIAMIVKPAAWYRFGLLPEQDQFVQDVTSQHDCMLVSLGTPEALEKYSEAAQRVCVYSDVFASQAALVDFLRGSGTV